jgi:DNA-binding transcriptional regulator YiaG
VSGINMQSPYSTTSAAGAMLFRQVGAPMLIGCMLAGFGTSTASTITSEAIRVQRAAEQTTAGASVAIPATAGASIAELRRLSGLTWDQLARLFSVSRRSLHFWASGKPMTPSNEEHLQRLLSLVRKIDKGSASVNRAALLGVREDGTIPMDTLAAGDYDRVLSMLGPGEARRVPPKLTQQTRAARAPTPPDELVGALQDRIHRERGAVRVAKSARYRGGR